MVGAAADDAGRAARRRLADGVWVHGGHGSLGMQAAPATAAWLAASMHGEASPPTFEELRPERFT